MSASKNNLVIEYLDDMIAGRVSETEQKFSTLRAAYADASRDLDAQIDTCAKAAKTGNGLFDTYRAGIAEREERVNQARIQLLAAIDAEAELKQQLRELRFRINKGKQTTD